MSHRTQSKISFATWNAASLLHDGRRRFLSTLTRKHDVVFLQECRIQPTVTFDSGDFLRYLPTAPNTARGCLTWDAGIVICRPDWIIEETRIGDRWVHVRVRLPEGSFLGRNGRQTLHLWSLSCPPIRTEAVEWWAADVPGFSRVLPGSTDLVVIGADWNALHDAHIDSLNTHPNQTRWGHISPVLEHLHLFDAFRFLHPYERRYTRYNYRHGEISGAKRIDSVWISDYFADSLRATDFSSSPSDHWAASIEVREDDHISDLGPGTWRLHPGVASDPAMKAFVADYVERLLQSTEFARQAGIDGPLRTWYAFEERLRVAILCKGLSIKAARDAALSEVQVLHDKLLSLDLAHPDQRRVF
ncbi:hypothetical protein IE81DRAFT_208972 [Ceraceosorus guamensis]|uniref:DNase I-like protein n=1 Tax=Ceraceosorus guamensis TaxID=1522189 RepID=A0A316WBC6_9BASI|nr:hypothetical protein IE81DRAFT_208972 [Ceraceosorus guamensis]PWN45233.1 hypothetical protein IE81DRAFT_208972 [Ceraceosorus guamensis]